MTRIRNAIKITRENIRANKWLAIATIIVSTILILVNSILISLAYMSNKAVHQYEKERQLTVYFEVDAPDEEVQNYIKELEKNPLVESTTFIDKEQAMQIFTSYQEAHGENTEGYSKEWFPASIGITAASLEDLEAISQQMLEEKENNPIIEDVVLKQDIIDKLKNIRKGIFIASIATVLLFSALTVILIVMAINFNILTHQKEIEIMHLVGSSDDFIAAPFIYEGIFYTTLASIITVIITVSVWYLGVVRHASPLVIDLIYRLDMPSLLHFNFKHVLIYAMLHIIPGFLLGFISSKLAVHRYLKFKNEAQK